MKSALPDTVDPSYNSNLYGKRTNETVSTKLPTEVFPPAVETASNWNRVVN